MTLTQFSPVAVRLRLTAHLGATEQAFTHDLNSAGAADQGVTWGPAEGDKYWKKQKEKKNSYKWSSAFDLGYFFPSVVAYFIIFSC